MQFGLVKRQLVLRQARRSQKLPYGSSFVRSGEMDDLVELHAAEQLVKRRRQPESSHRSATSCEVDIGSKR